MTKTIWTGTATAIVAVASVAVMAQNPAPQQTPGNATDRQITVTGCLKSAPAAGDATTTAGTAGATGTAGAVGTAGDRADANFVLTDATTSSAAPDPSGASTTTSASSQTARQTYRLIANPAALSPHVGKKLELTGTVEDQPASGSTTSSAAPASSTKALRVEAGKVIAASCEG
jgi:pilus assembly protein FimV